MHSLLNMITPREETIDEIFCSVTDPLHHAWHGEMRGSTDFELKHRSPIVNNKSHICPCYHEIIVHGDPA
jgi:hypothetical protein